MADEVTLPTEEEIAQLPRWARVAFAARCARRASAYFNQDSTTVLQADSKVLVRAIVFAEQSAAEATHDEYEGMSYTEYTPDYDGAAYASAYAAASAVLMSDVIDATDVKEAAVKAVEAGVPSSEIRSDFRRLQDKCLLQRWTDDTPVPPSVFDSLDEPAHALLLDLHSEPGADPHIIGDAIVKLWEAANEYHMAKGGGVLTLDEFQQFMPALVPVAPSVGG